MTRQRFSVIVIYKLRFNEYQSLVLFNTTLVEQFNYIIIFSLTVMKGKDENVNGYAQTIVQNLINGKTPKQVEKVNGEECEKQCMSKDGKNQFEHQLLILFFKIVQLC